MSYSGLFRIPCRSYIASFWAKSTLVEGYPGQKFKHQNFGRHRKLYNVIRPVPRVSEIKRIKTYGYQKYMSYATGRQNVMKKILNDEKFLGESV